MEENNYKKRSWHHDYQMPFIYHIIFKKSNEAPDFGFLRGDSKYLPGNPGSPYVFLSNLGKSIFNGFELFLKEFPIFEKFRHCIMPDHIHFILYKKERSEYHLDWYMHRLKEKMLLNYCYEIKKDFQINDIFEDNYTDKPLYDNVKLNNWFVYLNENPFRRLTIIQNRDFFKKIQNINLCGRNVDIYGNIFLLTYPEKFAVRIRRHFSNEEIHIHYKETMNLVEQGTVVISPFISKAEKGIRDAIISKGGRIILIQYNSFGKMYKPARDNFYLCKEGKLLIISLRLDPRIELSYSLSTEMNELAARLASSTFDTRLLPLG